MKKFLENRVNVIGVEKLNSKHPEVYASFVLTVDFNDYEKVTDPCIWPADLYQPFFSPETCQDHERLATTKSKLNVLILNIQSIRSKLLESELLLFSEEISVFGVTEH